jgi:hypothetical protein
MSIAKSLVDGLDAVDILRANYSLRAAPDLAAAGVLLPDRHGACTCWPPPRNGPATWNCSNCNATRDRAWTATAQGRPCWSTTSTLSEDDLDLVLRGR